MKPRHVYRPPRKNRFMSTLVIFGGGALLTFMVFYFIPLMQKLEQGMQKEKPDLMAEVQVEDQEEYVEPIIEEKKEDPPPPPDLAEASSDVPIDMPDLPSLSGGTGRVILSITPQVRLGGAGMMDTGGVDSDPVPSSKVKPSISDAINRMISKKGGVRVVVSALVDETGKVVETNIADSSGIPLLDQAAADAVQRYKFRPAIRSGRKAKANVKVPFDFRVR